jgi:hypothetical protein
MKLKPLLKAILVCDMTISEEGTRKRTLVGLFDRIQCANFPAAHPSMSVYVQFREIEGTYDFSLEMVDLSDNRTLHRAVVRQFRVDGRSRDCELVFNLLSIRFDKPGLYEFRVYVEDLVFAQKTIEVVK